MNIDQFCGDAVTHRILMSIDRQSYTPAEGDALIFTAKNSINDADSDAVFQKTLGAGISVAGSIALVETVYEDTADHPGGKLFYDIQAQLAAGGKPKTVAFGVLELKRDVTRALETSVPVVTTDPPVPFGKSAYDIAVDNGFEGTEEEWLESLQGATTWAGITDKPSTFPPSSHTHAWAAITDKPTAFPPVIGTGAGDAVAGNDARLSDARTPTAHTHTSADITDATALGNVEFGKVLKTTETGALSVGSLSSAGNIGAEGTISGVNRVGVLHATGQSGDFVNNGNLTAKRTYALPNASGTMALTSDIPDGSAYATAAQGTLADNATPKAAITTDSTGARTLALTDAWDYIRLTHATANTITVPTNASVAFPIGTQIYFRRGASAGALALSNAGVTVNGSANVSSVPQAGNCALVKIATDEWDFI